MKAICKAKKKSTDVIINITKNKRSIRKIPEIIIQHKMKQIENLK